MKEIINKQSELPVVEWHSRGYMPHRNKIGLIQSITFRLADSLPQKKLADLEKELPLIPEDKQDLERRKQIEDWLDSGIGSCALKHPDVARIMQETLLKFDGIKYHLLAWCIMPNHVHVLIEPNLPICKIVQSWKSFTGRWAIERNGELNLGISGKHFWMREYWDRFMRDENHLNKTTEYINKNPVKAKLCLNSEDWQWSSAGFWKI